jgi:hypothetical protein
MRDIFTQMTEGVYGLAFDIWSDTRDKAVGDTVTSLTKPWETIEESIKVPLVGDEEGNLPYIKYNPTEKLMVEVGDWVGNRQASQDFYDQWTSPPGGEHGSVTTPKPADVRREEAAQVAQDAEQKRLLDEISAMYEEGDATPLDREIAAISGEQWNRYIESYVPFENKAIADVTDTRRFTPQVQGTINANIMQKASTTGDFARAYGGGKGKAGAIDAVGGGSLAVAAARGAVEGVSGLAAEEAAMTQNVVELGRGGADFAVSSLGQAAGIATTQAISDWNYQFGIEKLDAASSMFGAEMTAGQQIRNNEYMASLISSFGGIATKYSMGGYDPGGGGQMVDLSGEPEYYNYGR